MNPVKVVILAKNSDSTISIYNGIKSVCQIDQVIIEESVSKFELLKRRSQKLGFLRVAGQLGFMVLNIVLKKFAQDRVNEIKNENGFYKQPIDSNKIVRVKSVNSSQTIELLKEAQPDVVVVNGTRIIRKNVLQSINAHFINTHVGITPLYRGVHGGYWALTARDQKHCGVTVHLIDAGIDTGGILYQDLVKVTAKDNFNTYPYLQVAAAIPLLRNAIVSVAGNSFEIKKVNLPSKLWSHPTIFEYLKYRILNGVK